MRASSLYRLFCALFICALFYALLAPEASAQQCIKDVSNLGTPAEEANDCQRDIEGITRPIMCCVQNVTNAIVDDYLARMADQLRNAVLAMMMLAIILLGYRIALRAEDTDSAKGATMSLLFKLLIVSYLVLEVGIAEWGPLMISSSQAVASALLGALPFTVDHIGQQSYVSNALPGDITTISDLEPPFMPDNPGGQELWYRFDQMIYAVLGIGYDTPSIPGGAIGIAAVLVGLIFLGPFGFVIFTLVIPLIIALIIGAATAVLTFAVTFLASAFLMSLAPLFIPMVLFRRTANLFNGWLAQLLSYSLQPILLTAFLVLMLNIMDGIMIDMSALYRDAFNTMQSPNAKNTVSVMTDEKKRTSAEEPGVEETFTGYIYRMSGAKLIVDRTVGYVKGLVASYVSVPFLGWNWNKIKEFIVTIILGFLLLIVMIGFQLHLPLMVTEILDDATVSRIGYRFVQRPLTRAGAAAQRGLVRGYDAVAKKGRSAAKAAVRKGAQTLRGGGG